jgi:hypothetical protein
MLHTTDIQFTKVFGDATFGELLFDTPKFQALELHDSHSAHRKRNAALINFTAVGGWLLLSVLKLHQGWRSFFVEGSCVVLLSSFVKLSAALFSSFS